MRTYSKFIPSDITSDQIPQQFSNELYLSELIDGYIYHSYTSVYSIKYQILGTEIYKLGNNEIKLEQNKYLVVNNNQYVTSLPYETERAITIFIDSSILNDVFHTLRRDDDTLLSNPFDYIDDRIMLYENCFYITNDAIGKNLKSLANSFNQIKRDPHLLKEDYFYKISKDLILSQQETFKQIKNIDCTKSSTKLELFERMQQGKQILINNWNKSISLNSISAQVCMSPYHFHHTFSKTFKLSPMKYHLKVRMKKSKELLKTHKYNISDVAILAGYSDIFSFSKAFKKHYGCSPSKYANLSGNI